MDSKMTSTPRRLHVFSHPRTGSNLFCKLFSQHPQIQLCLYNFAVAHAFGPEAQSQIKGAVMDELRRQSKEAAQDETYQASLDKIEEKIASAEAEGQIPLLKNHSALLIDSELIEKMLKSHRDPTTKPVVVDHMLDLPPSDRPKTDVLPKHSGSPGPESEHPAYNPTVIPDRFMNTLAPIFIIRHPVRQIESLYRTATRAYGLLVTDSHFELTASYKPSRLLYDYYAETYKKAVSSEEKVMGKGNAHPLAGGLRSWPVVIDGDDLIADPERIINKFCRLTGLDPSGVIYEWPKGDRWHNQGQPPIEEAYFGTLSNSEGVIANRYPNKLDLIVSHSKWKNEWGDEVANALLEYAKDAMTDYEYLHKAKL